MDLNTQSLLYAICREYAKKIDKASAFIWLHYKMFPDGCDIKMINKYFEACDLPKYNPTYLKNDLRKSKGIIAGKTFGTYKPNRELIEKLDAQFCDLILKDETIISDDRIIPKILYEETRGYIECLCKQINASYEYNIYDGCAILMRRLLEILLIHSYEAIGKIGLIQEASGEYKGLSYIINYTLSNKPFSLAKESQELLDTFRQLGNFSAHKIQYNAKRKYIDDVKVVYRLTMEELLYISKMKK